MKITLISTTLAAMLMLFLTAAKAEQDLRCNECVYSNAASAFCPDWRTTATKEFSSPDGQKRIVVEVKPMAQPRLHVKIANREYPVEFSPWPCPEFQWASDSKAFFLTYSTGGNVGNYEVMLYYPTAGGVKVVDPTSSVQKDFLAHYATCFFPETPNLAGITWTKDSDRLLVVAEVLNHSNCDMMGTFAAYEIEAPSGKIVKKYGQLEAKKQFWQTLGPALRNADDECFTKPESCEIPMLHKK